MSSATFVDFRSDPGKYLEAVCETKAPLRITREDARFVVIVSAEEYDSMVETLHLLASPANAKRLRASIGSADAGRLSERDSADFDAAAE